MGCGDSNIYHPTHNTTNTRQNQNIQYNYNNNPNGIFHQIKTTPRPKFLNPQPLMQSQLQTLWNIIQKNSLK